jgi:hypothetical protein
MTVNHGELLWYNPAGGGAGVCGSDRALHGSTPDYHSKVLIAYRRMGEGRARLMHKGIFVVVTLLEYYWWQNRQALSLRCALRQMVLVRYVLCITPSQYRVHFQGPVACASQHLVPEPPSPQSTWQSPLHLECKRLSSSAPHVSTLP